MNSNVLSILKPVAALAALVVFTACPLESWDDPAGPPAQTLNVTFPGANQLGIFDPLTFSPWLIPTQPSPVDIAVTADGNTIYLTNATTNSVGVFDANSGTQVSTILVGVSPQGIALSKDSTRGYVANSGSNTLSVFTIPDNTVISTISLPGSPVLLAVRPDGQETWASDPNHGQVFFIDNTTTNVSSLTVPTPLGIAFSPDGAVGVVASPEVGALFIDAMKKQVIATGFVPLASDVRYNPDGKSLAVTSLSGKVLFLDAASKLVIGTADIGGSPQGLLFTPNGSTLYVPRQSTDTNGIAVINTTSMQSTLVPTDMAPFRIGGRDPWVCGDYVCLDPGQGGWTVGQVSPICNTPGSPGWACNPQPSCPSVVALTDQSSWQLSTTPNCSCNRF